VINTVAELRRLQSERLTVAELKSIRDGVVIASAMGMGATRLKEARSPDNSQVTGEQHGQQPQNLFSRIECDNDVGPQLLP